MNSRFDKITKPNGVNRPVVKEFPKPPAALRSKRPEAANALDNWHQQIEEWRKSFADFVVSMLANTNTTAAGTDGFKAIQASIGKTIPGLDIAGNVPAGQLNLDGLNFTIRGNPPVLYLKDVDENLYYVSAEVDDTVTPPAVIVRIAQEPTVL